MMDARWLRPLGVGEVIDAALKIYRARFATMLKAVAVVVIPVQLINVIVVLSIPDTTTTGTTSSGFTTTTSTGSSAAVLAAFVVVQVVTILSGLVATAACLKVVSDAYLGTVTTWRESVRFGLSKFLSLVWIGFLSTAGVGLGVLFCIAPGIWLYVAWAVAVPALLIEGAKGTKALGRSFTLVRNRWWPTCGALLIAALITGVVTFALTIFTIPLLLGGASSTTTQVANSIAGCIAAVLTTPFTAAVTALIYFELRVRKEGFDLALMAQRIGVPPPPGGFAPVPWGGAPQQQPNQPWGQPPPPNQPWGTPPPPGAWSPTPGAWSPPPPQTWAPPPQPPPPPGAWTPPPPDPWAPPAPAPPTQPGGWAPPPIEPWDPIEPVPSPASPPAAPWTDPAPSPPPPPPEPTPPPTPAEEAAPPSSSPWASIPPDPDPPAEAPPGRPSDPPPEPPRDG